MVIEFAFLLSVRVQARFQFPLNQDCEGKAMNSKTSENSNTSYKNLKQSLKLLLMDLGALLIAGTGVVLLFAGLVLLFTTLSYLYLLISLVGVGMFIFSILVSRRVRYSRSVLVLRRVKSRRKVLRGVSPEQRRVRP